MDVQIYGVEMNRACSTNGRNENRKPGRKKHLEDLGIDGDEIIINLGLKEK
jgi:hypothetical protein